MGQEDRIIEIASTLLREKGEPQTGESLVNDIGKRLGQRLPPRAVLKLLQAKPHLFTVDGGGRWQLRPQQDTLLRDAGPSPEPASPPPALLPALRRGCYIIFDLEATRQDALSPYTEIIQIAAERWLDGVCQERWMRYVRPVQAVQERIHQLTHITPAELLSARPIEEVLPEFLNFVGDLPLIAHNGASYDGPLIQATCQRLHIPLPETFLVLDTLPLARALLPTAEAHRVGTLAERFGCARAGAHQAHVDVEMLAGIVLGLQQIIHEEPAGRAVYELLRRARDPWAQLLTPPAPIAAPEIIATFGARITPLLPETSATSGNSADSAAVEETFALAENLGRTRRPAQVELSHLAAETLRTGGYAIVEAGTGTGKSQGYLIPSALYARASGRPVAVSTNTRVLQQQLVTRELPFIQQLVPQISYALLQGRANYLSLSRLAEEVEDALAEEYLPPHRAWMLATLVRFAATSAHGNLEELGVIPQALDSFLSSDGAVHQILASVRASQDDRPNPAIPADFYRRARENADRANLVVVNHALLLKSSLVESEDDEVPFAGMVICDEAHTLEDAATSALERRVEERVLRRLLRAIHGPGRAGLVNDCLRRMRISSDDETLRQLAQIVDKTQAALDSLAEQLNNYVNRQTVVARSERERYGVRVRIERSALTLAGGGALKTAYQTLAEALLELRAALSRLIDLINATEPEESSHQDAKRRLRISRLARSLNRDLRGIVEHYQWFWRFEQSSNYVYVIALEKHAGNDGLGGRSDASHHGPPQGTAPTRSGSSSGKGLGERSEGHPQPNRATVVMSAVPINVGPLLWEHVWSRLDAAICTSATLTVYGQGFDFFLKRVGLEPERVAQTAPDKAVITRELPHAFDYHNNALLVLPNNLPAPRDSELKYNFQVAVADLLRRFIPPFEGKTLALFTANSRRDFVYEQIVDELAEQGYPLLSQAQGSLQRLVEEFRNDEDTSLLGSRSLWEGVDAPGKTLSYVFLEKMPYPSLGDPVEAARMGAVENAGGNAFYGYLLPKMVTQLKQGFGRLIRKADDRGAVILLDKRLRNSLYRNEVLSSLPDPTISYKSDIEMFREIASWIPVTLPEDLPAPTIPDVQRVLSEQELDTVYVAPDEFETLALPRLLAVQKAIWNQGTFRKGQVEIMRDVLAGKDVLTLLPTGAGKSRTYQLPALIRPGLTLVISPLIALIRDQVEKLREVPGITCVASLVSGMDAASQEEVLRNAAEGKIKLLYVSPERLRDPRFQAYLPQFKLAQLVVDEAHCISTWGHDFRPDFLGITNHLPQRGAGADFAIHALTATATKQVQDEIIQGLQMGGAGHERVTHTGNFVRENLIFRFYSVAKREERDILTLSIVHQLVNNKERGGAGIVYTATRKSSMQVARLLRDHNIAAQAYHGGLETAERHRIQELFMQGELDVVVATSAFGMGVDKAEIRFVLHYDHPASLEAYAQEAGRAGRDGKEAYAIMIFHRQSQQTERFIARLGVPDKKVIRNYRNALLTFGEEEGTPIVRLADGALLCNPDVLAELANVELTQARVLLYSFEAEGLIQRSADCTLEATLLLTQPLETILARITDSAEQAMACRLFDALKAEPERQVTYRAVEIYEQSSIDPRLIDPLLVKLADQELLLYRAYSRGITFKLDERIRNDRELTVIESRFGQRYQRFEERLQHMLDYTRLRRDQNRCRSAELINYLTGRDDAPTCGKCDLCSFTNPRLPWNTSIRLSGERLEVDIRMAVLGTVRDHNGVYGRGTVERILLGQDFMRIEGQMKRVLSAAACSSDHFEELKDRKVNKDHLQRTVDALIEGGYLQLIEKSWRGTDATRTYQALSITPKGRDALAGGVKLPDTGNAEVKA